MRIQFRDLLLLNFVVAMCLTACAVAAKKSVDPNEHTVLETAGLVVVMTLSMLTGFVAGRRSTLRSVRPIVAKLLIPKSWIFPVCSSAVALLISLLEYSIIHSMVCVTTGITFAFTILNLIFPYILVSEQGLLSQWGLHGWKYTIAIRDNEGLLKQLLIGKLRWGGLYVDIPPEVVSAIEDLLAKKLDAATKNLPE